MFSQEHVRQAATLQRIPIEMNYIAITKTNKNNYLRNSIQRLNAC